MSERVVELTVNGQRCVAGAEVRMTLADLLRDGLGLTGTHLGCEQGLCGGCTVLVDGEPVRSCLMLAVQASGADVVTIEGLDDGHGLHVVQQAMIDTFAFQCGFCAPGIVISALALLRRNDPDPDEATVRAELSGNLCRCTGYQSIVDGVLLAARRARDDGAAL